MNRVSVDIGGTFTDCFVAWGDRVVEAKSLTTHHNLAVGFNDALADACRLVAMGIGKNDRVALVAETGPEFAALFCACVYAGT